MLPLPSLVIQLRFIKCYLYQVLSYNSVLSNVTSTKSYHTTPVYQMLPLPSLVIQLGFIECYLYQVTMLHVLCST